MVKNKKKNKQDTVKSKLACACARLASLHTLEKRLTPPSMSLCNSHYVNNHDINPSLILENTFSIVPPGSPTSACLVSVDRHGWNSHLFGCLYRSLGLGALEDILTMGEGLRRKPVSGFAVY